ncbi:FUSC family protein [Streptomyces sp. LX-29]|uniref:FUSC family protein n=1 Tax=Streptomyces sp. LX-29 TaxID=2900152 RepID=UPI00240DB697|nr:FUSC family protein [Streptomyces sp. LX-29]WFB11468.1 FUSC family protein [Streptomyces sp. LX-29]
MFTAPDPGRLRLRTSGRAVVGVALAVAVSALATGSLVAAIAGGLAALLALFTVTDATVGAQARTTVLLPVVGFPVLALAAVLHDHTLVRDAVFLVIVFAGVYARRWGPRGHALGVFAFMTFFMAQFLHAVPGQLPGLYAATVLALTASSLVRFGLWCIERGAPPPAVPAPPATRGLARPTTRQAFQAAFACGLALAVGQVVSHERWYWAVGAAWWIFVNTASRGETLVRGFRRIVGTVTGIVLGVFVAVPLHGATAPSAVLIAVCVFGIFYTAPLSYSWMMFFVTVMASLLYGLLGVLHLGLLGLRLAQTGVGALAAVIAVALVLPVTTHAATDAWIQRALHAVRAATAAAARRLAGETADGAAGSAETVPGGSVAVPVADPAPHVAELELLLGRVRLSLAPLLHPLSPLRARKARARRVMVLLDDCARQVRGLAELAADPHPDASRDARLTAACQRVEAAIHALVSGLETPGASPDAAATAPPAEAPHPASERALAHLHGLETALAGLAAPLRSNPRAPFVEAA